MDILTWPTHAVALRTAQKCGALAEVHEALERAYEATADAPRLAPSSLVERELRQADWTSCRVWAPEELAITVNDKFDGWKVFKDHGQSFGVGVEIEWAWNRVYFDFLKFWRAQTGGQIRLGIEVLRGPSAFHYAVEHSYRLYQELIPDIHIVFCALDADDLRDPEYEGRAMKYRPFPMP